MHFADRIYDRMDKIESRLVIGIDPDPKRLFGRDSPLARAYPGLSKEALLDEFCDAVIDAASRTACAVKPQAAFFESMGVSGLRALARCMQQARARDILVILDAKRGDIGNTAAAYASAYLDPSSDFFADALTVNPYLGPDTLEPFIDAAGKAGCGLFVLVKTSNPGSGAFQDTILKDGRTLFMKVAAAVAELGKSHMGECGYSDIGAVVGATYPHELADLRRALPRSIFLLPGYGAQGGTAEDVKGAFNEGGRGAVVSSSRGIIFAYEKAPGNLSPEQVRGAMLAAAVQAQRDIQLAAGS